MDLKQTLLMPKNTFDMKANLPIKEPNTIAYWTSIRLYEMMLAQRADAEEFQLHDGPPYANGDIHVGHMLNRLLKDTTVRYKHLRGYKVPFVFGWDTHGLPIENYLAKKGINRKTMSVAEFREHCDAFARSQVQRQKEQLQRLGVVGDMENPYLTLQPEYEAEQIAVFAKMAMKGLIYKGLKPVYWSPSSESALAEAEIVYEDVVDHSIYVAFDVVDGKGVLPNDARVVIWTTTPWTLPANLAISAHPDFEYGIYETNRGKLVLAIGLVDAVAKACDLGPVTLLETIKGKALETITCQHPFYERTSLMILGDHVTLDAGTGFVHTAPGHGEEDFIVGQKYQLPPLCPVDSKGVMTEEAGEGLAGLFYTDANQWVLTTLTASGHLLADIPYPHSYPHDWRTGKPLIYRATPQWFASIDPIRQELLDAIAKVHWTPKWGEQRIHNMIKDRGDWCISRQRAWGVPIPIIYHEDGTPIMEDAVFNHIQSLFKTYGSRVWFEKEPKDLLPPGYQSPLSPNGQFKKETDIMDVWFDSGSSSLAVLNQRGMKFPADLYLEGSDQYRGWFNSSLIIAIATEGVSPYQAIVSHGFVVDGKGEKMSKSKGNGIDPLKMMQVYGADIMRLWATSIDFTADARASEEIFKGNADMYRKIRNTFKFMLGNLWVGEEPFTPEAYPVADFAWIDHLMIAKLEAVVHRYQQAMDAYNFAEATSEITTFLTQDLSSFYLDIAKDILYCEAKTSVRRLQVLHVLYRLVHDLTVLLTPILPFTMEEVYQTWPQKPVASSQLLAFPHGGECEEVETLAQFYETRSHVSKALETLRSEGTIGSSLEARVKLGVPETMFNHLQSLDVRERNRLFIVSQLDVEKATNIYVEAHASHGEKCPRCWNYFPQLVSWEEGHVCERCVRVIRDEK
jgi:isoleucyl-tRNA synthetase